MRAPYPPEPAFVCFFLMVLLPPRSTLFPYTTLFRSRAVTTVERDLAASDVPLPELFEAVQTLRYLPNHELQDDTVVESWLPMLAGDPWETPGRLGQYEACLAWTLDTGRTKRWPHCEVPCLVVAFEHDVDSPPARAREA